MPRMCGPEACKKMRDVGFAGLIIGLTGNALEQDIAEYMAQGASAVLKKRSHSSWKSCFCDKKFLGSNVPAVSYYTNVFLFILLIIKNQFTNRQKSNIKNGCYSCSSSVRWKN